MPIMLLFAFFLGIAVPHGLYSTGPSFHATHLIQHPSLIKSNELIVIDPGHGGKDIGTQSISKPRYREKSLNLVTARLVRDFLVQRGYNVVLTREQDHFISLKDRAKLANEKKATVFVSIHYNAAPSREAEGIEVFYYACPDGKKRTIRSQKLGRAVLRRLIAITGAKSRGLKQGRYAVIKETQMPAILVEGGFLTHAEELERLKDPVYLRKIAWGISIGIQEFLHSKAYPNSTKKTMKK